jgi:broad specificity phosphatase PhoE
VITKYHTWLGGRGLTTIDLIRHGETVWNREKRLQGHSDVFLSERGKEQAEKLAEYMKDISISVVYSSDLRRALDTAKAIAEVHALSVIPSKELRERNMGVWAGKTLDDIQKSYLDWEQVRISGGAYGIEETKKLSRRVLNELKRLVELHKGEHICVVSHGGCINSVLSEITQGKYGIGKSIIENTSITRLRFHETDGWKVEFANLTPHLKEEGK